MNSMKAGLDGKPSSLLMINTHVNQLLSKGSSGVGLALDLGSTNFRVLKITTNGENLDEVVDYYDVSDTQRLGTSEQVGSRKCVAYC